MLDFSSLNNQCKIKWIIEYLKNKDTIWNAASPNSLVISLQILFFAIQRNTTISITRFNNGILTVGQYLIKMVIIL